MDGQDPVSGVSNHLKQTWEHVFHGKATASEYAEAGIEVAAATLAAVALSRVTWMADMLGFAATKDATWATRTAGASRLTDTSSALPHLETASAAQALEAGTASAVRSVDQATLDRIATMRKSSDAVVPPDLHRVDVSDLAVGQRFKMTPFSESVYEVQGHTDAGTLYRDVNLSAEHFPSQTISSQALVRTGPNLITTREQLGLAPIMPDDFVFKYAKYADRLAGSSAAKVKARWRRSSMSGRPAPLYEHMLEIDKSELAPGKIVVDIGAGANQEFARSVTGAKVIPIDPKMALSEAEDLAMLDHRIAPEYRLAGRAHPHPLTVAAKGNQLPLADHSVDGVYALFSMPMYAENDAETLLLLSEVQRAAKQSGGIGRIYPVQSRDLPVVEKWLAENRIADDRALVPKPLPKPPPPLGRFSNEGHDYHLLTLRF